MIIKMPNENSIVKWKNNDKDDWKSAEISDLIKAYEKRPHGKWIKWDFKTFGAMGDWEYKCSNCEKVYGGEYNFCPNCGIDMREGDAE